MARATKKQRGKDSSKFKGAVDASAKQDALEGTGVVHEDGQPVYLEKLSETERAEAGELLADKLLELAEVEQDAKDTAAKFRKDVKARRKSIAELRDEVHEGMRRRPAQQNLGGVQ
jgi:hypothetical protein